MHVIDKLLVLLAKPLILVVRVYQLFISPFLGQNCRFHPSCSCYAHEALQQHGALRGSYLSIKRILKCQPMHKGGLDPVPKAKKHPKLSKSKLNTN